MIHIKVSVSIVITVQTKEDATDNPKDFIKWLLSQDTKQIINKLKPHEPKGFDEVKDLVRGTIVADVT